MLTNAQIKERWTAAIDSGAKTFVGRPCKHGHDGVRYANAWRNCVECERQRPPRPAVSPRLRAESAANQRRRKVDDPAYALWSLAKHRARRRGMAFDLTLDEVVVPETCPVLGIPLILGATWAERLSAPSLDRVDNTKGYVSGNVQVISLRANQIKNDSLIEELEAVLAYMKAHGAK